MRKLFCICLILSSLSCDDQNAEDPHLLTLSPCKLIPDPGPCDALIKRYYFDKKEGKCKSFYWGGCEGVVPFKTLEECKICENPQIPWL